MSNKDYSILVLDNGRQALPFIMNYYKSGFNVTVISDTILCETFFSLYPSKKIIWPKIESIEFLDILLDYIKTNNTDFILSVGDTSAEFLSKNKYEISKYSSIIQPDYGIFHLTTDKLLLMQYCLENHIPCPKTYPLVKETVEKNFYDLRFPIIIKPRKGIGAIGIKKYDNKEDIIRDYELQLNKYGEMLVQEYIPQKDGIQYQAEVFLDNNSKVKTCVVLEKPRYFPVEGGTSTANFTIENNQVKKSATLLLENIKWKGAADIDLVLDSRDNLYKILEVNPRVTAGIKTAFKAGVDFAKLHIDMALGKNVEPIESYELGIYCRNIILDILWFIYSKKTERKKHLKSFFDFFGKNKCEQTFDIKDPFTFLGFFLHILVKYFNINKLKEKLHL